MKTDYKRIDQFYKDYVVKQGTSIGWPNFEYAQMAYHSASNTESQKWDSIQTVLDVGSGEGHFLDYLRKKRGYKGYYFGLELLPMFHNAAIEQYSKDPLAKFVLGDFLEYDFGSEEFDWVISLGGLSVKQERQDKHDFSFFSKMATVSHYGISIYLNDMKKIERTLPGRLNEFPELAVHNIGGFVSMVEKHLPKSKIEINCFPSSESHSTLVHITK